MTMCNKSIKWAKKEGRVYNKAKGESENIPFLRLNVTDDYNYGMGDVDVADKHRGTYRVDTRLWRFKWWHAIFWWGVQVLFVSSYVIYKQCIE